METGTCVKYISFALSRERNSRSDDDKAKLNPPCKMVSLNRESIVNLWRITVSKKVHKHARFEPESDDDKNSNSYTSSAKQGYS